METSKFKPQMNTDETQILNASTQSLVTTDRIAICNPQSAIDSIQAVESAMLKMPQADCPVTNVFAPGIYWREIEIPAGAIALGHKHKTEHVNVLLAGRVRVLCDGQVTELVAPQVFVSPPGVRKLLYAVERTRWANIHANPTDETDMEKLEVIFIEKSESFLAHQEEIAGQISALPSEEPSPHPDPLPSHRMGAEREQQSDAVGYSEAVGSHRFQVLMREIFLGKSLKERNE
jgi:quercetin dioxygenase-like cupin family protein